MRAFFLLLLVVMPFLTRAQDTASYVNLDTLIFYDVSLASGPQAVNCSTFTDKAKTKVTYYVNCREVSEAVYMKYKKGFDNLGNCTPCILKHFSEDDQLTALAVQYTDCRVGYYYEYYPGGKIKVAGHYKMNTTRSWKNLWNRKFCSVRHGTWMYYRSDGSVEKTEQYDNDVLLK